MKKPPFSFIAEQGKRAFIKKKAFTYLVANGNATILELAHELDLSVPTTTKLVEEFCQLGFIMCTGKLESNCGGGRQPNVYGLNPNSCYFVGVDLKYNAMSLGVIDMTGSWIDRKLDIPYQFEDTPEMLQLICERTQGFINSQIIDKKKIMAITMTIPGRVNPETGESFAQFRYGEKPLADLLTEKLGYKCYIDNDTRAMTYGEYMLQEDHNVKHALFINVSWGLGMGIIFDGKLYGGKNGFAGEIGHFPTFENEVICHCGKKGCLETEASGRAIYRKVQEHLNAGENSVLLQKFPNHFENITLTDIMEAVEKEDLMCIELIEEIGLNLGKEVAGLINIFNPELVIIGGTLSQSKDYLLEPIRAAVRKYSLSMVNRFTEVVGSKQGDEAGVIGACMLSRYHIIDM